jgi:hypothetical protein
MESGYLPFSITHPRFDCEQLLPAAFTSDGRHVFAVLADDHSAAATRFTRLFGRKFVSGSFGVSGFSAFAGDASLFIGIHRRESAPASVIHGLFLSLVGPKYDFALRLNSSIIGRIKRFCLP